MRSKFTNPLTPIGRCQKHPSFGWINCPMCEIEKTNKTAMNNNTDSMKQKVSEIITAISDRHPYKQSGNRESYSTYNEAWSDACDVLGQEILKLFDQPTLDIEKLWPHLDIDGLINRCQKKQQGILKKYNELSEKEQFGQQGIELHSELNFYNGKTEMLYYIKSYLQHLSLPKSEAVEFAKWLRNAEWQDGTKTLFIKGDYDALYNEYEIFKSETQERK